MTISGTGGTKRVIIRDESNNKASIDSSTNALLVKEVTGATETTKIQGYTTDDIFYAQVDISTTEAQLTTETSCLSVTVKADDDNTDAIYIGKTGLSTTTGFRLNSGQAVTLYINDPSILYAISGTTGQKVYVMGEK